MSSICRHKFYDDLNLNYVDWNVETLFVGTFNPGCCEKEENNAEWFYGRTENNMFWDTLGFIYSGNPDLGGKGNPEVWKNFCREHKLAVTDLIKEVKNLDLSKGPDRSDLCKGFSDTKLECFIRNNKVVPTEVEKLVSNSHKFPNLKSVCLTRKSLNKHWRTLWNPVNIVCEKQDLYISNLTTPGRYNFYQFRNGNQRTPENLAKYWRENDGFRV